MRLSQLNRIGVIPEQVRHLGREKIINEFFHREETKVKGKAVIVEDRYQIDENWVLSHQRFEWPKYTSAEERDQLAFEIGKKTTI